MAVDERAAVHMRNLPDSAGLEEIFLLASHQMHGMNTRGPSVGCSLAQGTGEPQAGKEPPFPCHPSGNVRNGTGCTERERKK